MGRARTRANFAGSGATLFDEDYMNGDTGTKETVLAILRIVMVALIFQTVIFASLWFYARAKRREVLETEWADKEHAVPREAYVKAGLTAYEAPLKRKLIWGAYVIPSALITLLLVATSTD